MKRGFILLLSLIVLTSFVFANESPELYGGTAEEDAAKVEGLIQNYSPLDEDGKINPGIYNGSMTKAEQNRQKVNLWLKENASWLKAVFAMVPEVSWLFATNLYIMLFFFMVLVLNGHVTFSWFESLKKRVDMLLFEWTWANLFGIVIYVGLLALGTYLKISEWILSAVVFIWEVVLPVGLVAAIFTIIGIILLVVFSGGTVIMILGKMGAAMAQKKAMNVQKQNEENAEILENLIDNALKVKNKR